jgi:exoribonuclease-2
MYIGRMHDNPHHPHQRADLVRIATSAMSERGLQPEFSASALHQLCAISGPSQETGPGIRELVDLLWCSIDNDDSVDLDQLTVCEAMPGGSIRLLVAIADVDALVKKGSPIDDHARLNTTSVYTSARVFPMLPERLCTDLTSLNFNEDRLAVVTEMVFNADASLAGSTVYRARVRNKAKLAYDAVSAWMDGTGALPAPAAAVPGMDIQLRMQDSVAQKLRVRRRAEGSLEFETFQPRAVFDGEQVVDIRLQVQNRARQLIEEVMIATNGCTARFLAAQGGASLRRVVRSPERWLRIVAVAKEYGDVLPPEPDSKALEAFLAKRHKADPLRFPDLSLAIVRLMGSGEYVVETPGGPPVGHFGLAVRDYTHSTAPNRRFPDLITSRLVKAALQDQAPPYSNAELGTLALHCTRQEDSAQKVERRMRKSEAALVLETHVGQRYDAIVTGSTTAGIWVRIFSPPADGKLASGAGGLKVGDKLHVKLVSTSVEHGFIDFAMTS